VGLSIDNEQPNGWPCLSRAVAGAKNRATADKDGDQQTDPRALELYSRSCAREALLSDPSSPLDGGLHALEPHNVDFTGSPQASPVQDRVRRRLH